ncbi:MAG: VanW family protein [Clostridia bacterium]|nr:VanW family protein [Clostridia bacterium]
MVCRLTVVAMLVLFQVAILVNQAWGSVMVPARVAFERQGITVGWDGRQVTGQWPGGVLRFVPGASSVFVNDVEHVLERSTVVMQGTSFVPGSILEHLPVSTVDHPGPVEGITGTVVQVGDWSYLLMECPPRCYSVLDLGLSQRHWARPGSVWLLPDRSENLVGALVRLFEKEVRAGGGGNISLAPEAPRALIAALEAKQAIVTLPTLQLIGQSVVNFNAASSYNNMLNAVQATKYMNGTVVPPGAVFSYNQAVGRRTVARGFVTGYAISGNSTVPAVGGGVCRTSTVVYGAVLDAGLPVVERHPHSRPVGYVSVGKDATVTWGVHDMRFKNDRPHPVRVETGGTVHQLYVRLWEVRS